MAYIADLSITRFFWHHNIFLKSGAFGSIVQTDPHSAFVLSLTWAILCSAGALRLRFCAWGEFYAIELEGDNNFGKGVGLPLEVTQISLPNINQCHGINVKLNRI